jgi:hypothetical protein
MRGEQREPLDLRGEDVLDLGMALDFHILLRAIDQAMPTDATLALEGGATAPAIQEFLLAHQAPDPRELVAGARGKVVVFHLPLADGNLGQLRLLAEDCVSSEVALHLAVYRGDTVLLWAHDAGGGSLLVAGSLPPETVDRLRAALGPTLKPHPRYRWFGLRRVRDQ